jgi:5-methylthioadenosine/S-adenosylhomocysteine deaminase
VQVKVPDVDKTAVLNFIHGSHSRIIRQAHYRQFDHYFIFDGNDPDAARLRHREDEFIDEEGTVYQTRSRLTLTSQAERQEFPNAVMLSRTRYMAEADRSLRFYREYFAPAQELEVSKDRLRWHILYQDTDFAVNLDQLIKPALPGYFLEIKSRTWSRTDAERKAGLIAEMLQQIGVNPGTAERQEYAEIAINAIASMTAV